MTDANLQPVPDVTEEFLSLLRPVGTPHAAGELMAADGKAVAIASRSGGTPVIGFGPAGETVMLPGDFFLRDSLILDGGRAWGLLVSGGSRRLAMWEPDGRMRDLLKEAGLRAYGSGMPAVADPWVAWFTAEEPQRVALLNVQSGELHFVTQPPGTMCLYRSALQLFADAGEAKLLYRVVVRPGQLRFELYDSISKTSTALELAANSVISDGTRLIWCPLPAEGPSTISGPGSTTPDSAKVQSLVCASWSEATRQRTLGHPSGGVQAAYGQVAWLEAGGILKVDDGDTHVVASGLDEPFIVGVGGNGLAYVSGAKLHLWTRERGTRLFSHHSSLPVFLSRSHLFVAAPQRLKIGERPTIFAMPLSEDDRLSDDGHELNADVRHADALTTRHEKPFAPSQSPKTEAAGPVTADSVIDRLERLMAARFPQATYGSLRPAATPAQLQAFEAAIGQRLPDDVRALYLRHDGTVLPHGRQPADELMPPLLLPFSHWCSLDDMLRTWQRLQSLAEPSEYNTGAASDGMPMRSDAYNRAWIPIGISNTIDSAYIDLDPSPWGTRGQLFSYDLTEEPTIMAASLTEYLHKLLGFAEQGLIEARQGTWLDTNTRERVFRLD